MRSKSDTDEQKYGTRRNFLKTGAGLAALGVAGCVGGGGGSDEPTESSPLKVEFFGGVFQEVLNEHLVEPFREDTGIPIESSAGTSAGEPLQLKQAVDAGEAPIDMVAASPVNRIRGERLGIWHTYEEDDIPNSDLALPSLVSTDESGAVSGIGAYGWFSVPVTQTDLVDEPITSWKAIWDDQYTWALGQDSDSSLLDLTANMYFDGRETLETEDGIVRVMEKIAEATGNVGLWYDGEAQAQQALLNEEVDASWLFNDVTLVMEDDGAPVTPEFPEEGAVQNDANWVILDSTSYPDAAKEFLNYTLQPEVQENISKNLYTYPTLKTEHIDLGDELEDRIFGPGAEEAFRAYYEIKLDNEQFINEKWREIVL